MVRTSYSYYEIPQFYDISDHSIIEYFSEPNQAASHTTIEMAAFKQQCRCTFAGSLDPISNLAIILLILFFRKECILQRSAHGKADFFLGWDTNSDLLQTHQLGD